VFVHAGTVADVSGSVTASLTPAIIKAPPQAGPDTSCSRAIWRPNAVITPDERRSLRKWGGEITLPPAPVTTAHYPRSDDGMSVPLVKMASWEIDSRLADS